MLDHLIINLDPGAETSLQAQIRESVVEAILARAILPGDRLPSSRMLAAQLGVLDLRGRRSVQADCSAKLTG